MFADAAINRYTSCDGVTTKHRRTRRLPHCTIPFTPISPHTLGPNFYSYIHLRKPCLAHMVTRYLGGFFFFFLAPVRTNFGHFWAGRSQSELFSQLPQFCVRTFPRPAQPTSPPIFGGPRSPSNRLSPVAPRDNGHPLPGQMKSL